MHPVWPRMAHYNPYIIFDKIVLKERGGVGGLEIFNAKLQTSMDIWGTNNNNWPGRVFILFQTNECDIVLHLVFRAPRWVQYIPRWDFLFLCEMKENSKTGHEQLTIRYMGLVYIIWYSIMHISTPTPYIGGLSVKLPGYKTTWQEIQ